MSLEAEDWRGAEGAKAYSTSPGEALVPLEQAAGAEDKMWLQSGGPRFLAGAVALKMKEQGLRWR